MWQSATGQPLFKIIVSGKELGFSLKPLHPYHRCQTTLTINAKRQQSCALYGEMGQTLQLSSSKHGNMALFNPTKF